MQVIVITEVNSAVHAPDSDADAKKRTSTRPELQPARVVELHHDLHRGQRGRATEMRSVC
jgi:hypothetical protein